MHEHDARIITPARRCAPRARCRDWRHCEDCARIRQAKIANVAERLESFDPDLTWTCLHPVKAGAAAAIAARAEWLRKVDPPGALWTVEQSSASGALHINIIAPTDLPPDLNHSKIWQQRIDGSSRNVAAYISKRSQMPARAEFPGRLFGTCGPLWSWLANAKQLPAVAAATLQQEIDGSPTAAAAAQKERRSLSDLEMLRGASLPAQELTREEYRAIAARRIPDILGKGRPRAP